MHFSKSVNEGHSAEVRFAADYILSIGKPKLIQFANAYQDMRQHWDICIDDMKIDVKARRRVKRAGEYVEGLYIFELLNVSGKDGWGLGQADAIAYETLNTWKIVEREALAKECLSFINPRDCEPLRDFVKPMLPYRRKGREDLFTWLTDDFISKFVLFEFNKISA